MLYFNYLFSAIVGYLIGSIPFGYILVKIFHKQDIRTIGSGNIGATNVYRAGYKELGIATFILDAAKALMAIFFISQLEIIFSDNDNQIKNVVNASLIAGFFAVIGHVYSIFLRGKGGKGVSTMIGYFLYISIPMTIIGLIAWITCFKLSRYSSLSSLLLACTATLYSLIFLPINCKIAVTAIAALVIYQHKENIKRLIKNEENKIK
jgi:glycerol-3-phosphate acyltransferase PlsY